MANTQQCAICGAFIAYPKLNERWIKCKVCGVEWENATYEPPHDPDCPRCHGKGFVGDTQSPDFVKCRYTPAPPNDRTDTR